jgi:4'-phosphopantetheinyl transferase
MNEKKPGPPIPPNPFLEQLSYVPFQTQGSVGASWQNSEGAKSIGENAIHIWAINLAQSEISNQKLRTFLSKEERLKANSFYQKRDKDHYVVGRAMLKILLSQYAARLISQIEIKKAEDGKPYIEDSILRFNKTSSGHFGLIALSPENELGIDIEQTNELADLSALTANVFSEEERERHDSLTLSQRKDFFYTVWTQKEALLKAMGIGLSFPLQQVNTVNGITILGMEDSQASKQPSWQVKSFIPSSGFQASLVTQISNPTISFLRLRTP